MIETLHRIGSRIRHAHEFEHREWLWDKVEPAWQTVFGWLAQHRGYATRINDDVFRLEYSCAARYDRPGRRAYEPLVYQTFVQLVREGMQVFDIGAHIGIFALGAAKRVGSRGKVYAFEPSPETTAILRRHVALNEWQDRVEVIGGVVSDVNGVVPFYTRGTTMAASLGRANVEVLSPERFDRSPVEVEASSVTLDQFCAGRSIVPDVVKIDVEGAELLTLRGAHHLLLNESLSILCEVHPQQMQNCGSSLSEMEAYLSSVGYSQQPIGAANEMGIFHSLITRRR